MEEKPKKLTWPISDSTYTTKTYVIKDDPTRPTYFDTPIAPTARGEFIPQEELMASAAPVQSRKPKVIPGVMMRVPEGDGYWVRVTVNTADMIPTAAEVVRFADGVVIEADGTRTYPDQLANVCYVLLW